MFGVQMYMYKKLFQTTSCYNKKNANWSLFHRYLILSFPYLSLFPFSREIHCSNYTFQMFKIIFYEIEFLTKNYDALFNNRVDQNSIQTIQLRFKVLAPS